MTQQQRKAKEKHKEAKGLGIDKFPFLNQGELAEQTKKAVSSLHTYQLALETTVTSYRIEAGYLVEYLSDGSIRRTRLARVF